jgi:hypothetical protein
MGRVKSWLSCGGLLFVLTLAFVGLVPVSTSAELGPSSATGQRHSADESALVELGREQRQAQRAMDRLEAQRASVDYRASLVRIGIAAGGLALFASGFWLRGEKRGRASRIRLILLCLLGLAAYASYYHFFQLVHRGGFAGTDNYHYYVGSKYFSELGYYGLYECSLVALDQKGLLESDARLAARDLRSMDIWPESYVRVRATDCPERFGAERWREFGRDVAWFYKRWPEHIRRAVWSDHGYHPTPIWSLIGGSVASLVSIRDTSDVWLLGRLDRLLIALALAAVAWAFGLEIASLAAIVWGTGYMWRYGWVGDAMLRHAWWVSLVLGICLLRRGYAATGGASLGLATLLRLFPGVFPLGYLVRAGRRAWQERSVARSTIRFMFGAGATCILLVLACVVFMDQGIEAFLEFGAKIGKFVSAASTNKVGLGVVASWLFPETPWAARCFEVIAAVALLALVWRALREAEDWEAAALGFVLIPILTQPTNYYYSFVVVGALLAARRPMVGGVTLIACIAWGTNGLVFYRQPAEFVGASLIAAALSFAVAIAMARPVREAT